ncbi:MAG: SLC26A/SulP transporter family protein [Desulfobacterales bacterium]|nr:SLC26A/SulP transporter family protein [Desulfobacterales bacterium]
MEKHRTITTLKGDVFGAVSAATINLPMAIGYGITGFFALGNDFIPQAVILGVSATIFSCLFTALFSGTPTLISGPSGPLTIVLISIVAKLQNTIAPFTYLQNHYALVIGSAALCLIIGGLLQALLGFFRIGSLVKYVPYPVISGFVNGIALSLILHQLPNLLGIDISYKFFDVIRFLHSTDPGTLLIGVFTFGSVILARRYISNLSPPLFGLLAGTTAYYLMHAAVPAAVSGRVIGDIRIDLLTTAFVGVSWRVFDFKLVASVLPDILFFGMIICLISSVETLMSSAAIGYRTGDRFDSNKDLVGQGIGNVAAAFFSAMPASGSLVRSFANLNSGAKTRWSGVMCSLMILLIFLLAYHYLGRIPLTVLSGVIIAIGFSLFDLSEFFLFRAALRSKRLNRDVALNLLINLTVIVLTVAVDLTLAIIVGILITTANFVVKTGKSVVRRKYRCNQVRSKRVRNMEQTRLIKDHGSKILVVELQGPIFFGSAEEVAREIDASNHDAEYIVINMKRVSEIDHTGTRYLLQIHNSLKKQDKTLLISHISEGDRLWDTLSYADAIDKIGRDNFFLDMDRALEYAEDQILCGELIETPDRQYALSEMDIFAGFSEKEIKIVESRLVLENYMSGDVIIREGDRDRDLFMLARGMVSVKMQLQNNRRERRLNSITAGVTFGEIALLDNKPRSADVVTESDVTIYRLTYDKFLDLQQSEPNVANKLILNMALNLSTRLRLNTEEIKVLVEN